MRKTTLYITFFSCSFFANPFGQRPLKNNTWGYCNNIFNWLQILYTILVEFCFTRPSVRLLRWHCQQLPGNITGNSINCATVMYHCNIFVTKTSRPFRKLRCTAQKTIRPTNRSTNWPTDRPTDGQTGS